MLSELEALILKARIRRQGLAKYMSVFSDTTPHERLKLYWLASSQPKGARALEIGSHLGSSALFLAAGLKNLGGRLYCVDTWMNETMPDGPRNTYFEFSSNTRPYASIITPIRKKSQELADDDIGGQL